MANILINLDANMTGIDLIGYAKLRVIKILNPCKGCETIVTIKELIQQVVLFVRTLQAIVAELEEHGKRLYALEENRKAKDATISQMQQEIATLKLLARRKVVE